MGDGMPVAYQRTAATCKLLALSCTAVGSHSVHSSMRRVRVKALTATPHLQVIDPHTNAYLERMKDEPLFLALAQKVCS